MKLGVISATLNEDFTGVPNYTYNLISELDNLMGKDSLHMINYQDDPFFKNIHKFIIKNPLGYLSKLFPLSSYFWYTYLGMKLNAQNFDLDIVHNPYQVPTLFKFKKQKYVVTVHDLMQVMFPEMVKPSVYFIQKFFLPKTLKYADAIITDSYSTKNDLITLFKIPEHKINVIYLAANNEYKLLDSKEVGQVKKRYGIDSPFILYVGSLKPLKNISTLIKSFYHLKKKNLPHKLVITGKRRLKYKEIFRLIDELNLQNDIIFTGYVDKTDLPALYNAAELFVSPSIYEGFGLPPLEAMACGCPVITSNTSSLPEVVGDAGIMVDPYDVDGLADSMYEVLTNDRLKNDMSKKGLNRAKMFSWEKCARETLKVYEEVFEK
ncbi:MAG: glycosyltransferase family 1 protein [Methanosarcina sp.]|nr:glycosyltransferase family 1 protein [Methanosarcina sp.]